MDKQFLFVDDEESFLTAIKQLFTGMAPGKWNIFTAQNHAQALEILQNERISVVVLDVSMPVMDGFQFLRLLQRTNPGQQVVMLTGDATPERRKMCAESGAALMLEKPTVQNGYADIFATLDALAAAHPQIGFRGTMRQVGLQEVLQMECLGRKSSILEIFTGRVRGRIHIFDGSIIQAQSGDLQGEAALYGLLALRGGEFNLLPFAEPSQRTISGHWEFLLMEAARLQDEGTTFIDLEETANPERAASSRPNAPSAPPQNPAELIPGTVPNGDGTATVNGGTNGHASRHAVPLPDLFTRRADSVSRSPSPDPFPSDASAPEDEDVRIAETLLCSGGGEVLYEAGCDTTKRSALLEQIEQQAAQLSALAPAGRFDRLEILATEGRIVCHVQPDRRVFVRSVPNEPVLQS
jgi:CheY-like chemotaxis protein